MSERKQKLSVVDRTIAAFSPAWARDREIAKLQLKELRSYDGASRGRRLSGWITKSDSPESVTRGKIIILRNRTRDLERNNSWYRRAIDILVNNVVGVGIKGQIINDGISINQRDKAQKQWDRWAGSKDCDFDGRNDFYGLQRLAYRTACVAGEVLILRRVSKSSGLQLQVLEPDFLDETQDKDLTNGGYIRQGIEFNKKGQRVGYWLFDEHPNSGYSLKSSAYVSKRYSASDVIHLYLQDRPGQIRGVPKGTQVIVKLHDLEAFQDAELMKNKVAALFTAFRTKPLGSGTPKENCDDGSTTLYPGTFETLLPGEDVKFAQPPQNQMYPEFVRTNLMAIASAFGMTYEMLSGDLSKTNFSSGRMGGIEAARYFKADQKDVVINGFCDVVCGWWKEIAVLQSGVRTNNVFFKWTAPHREMIDPAKEFKALAEAKNENLLPIKHIWNQFGFDTDQTIEDIKEVQEKMDAAGIRSVNQPHMTEPDEDSEEEEKKNA